jgi:hypothetical protein
MNLRTHISFETRAKTFWTLVTISVACLVVYIYAVNATVHNTVTRVALQEQNAAIATKIGEMEFSYIGLKNNISLAVAYTRGFHNVDEPIYISRGAHSLSFNSKR